MFSNTTALRSYVQPAIAVRRAAAQTLSWPERFVLMVGIIEIPLQLDKYFMYHERDAKLGAVGGFNVSITTLALVALYAVWFFRKMSPAESPKRSGIETGIIWGIPMLLYLAAVALSSLSAAVPMLSLFDLFLLVQAYLLFFYIANRVRCRTDFLCCLLALATTLTIQSGLIFMLKVLSIDNQEIQIGPLMLTVWEGERHGGSMQSPVLAGSTMALIWLPIATLMLSSLKRFEWRRWVWLAAMAATVCGMLAILLTQTRGAILTSVVGSGIIGAGLFFRGWLPKWTIVAVGLMLVLSLYPLWLVYINRIQSGDGESAVARKHLSLIALEMIQDRPVFGFGAGNCHIAGQQYADQGKWRAEWYYTIHSKYLLVWVETGLLGFLTFAAMLWTGALNGIAAWNLKDRFLAPIGLALSSALMGHGLHLAVDIFNSRTQVQMLWAILGLLAAVRVLANETQATKSHERREGSDASGIRKLSNSFRGQQRNVRPVVQGGTA